MSRLSEMLTPKSETNVSRGSVKTVMTSSNFPDDAAAVHGMPVSLQLVAQRLEEEKVIAMTRTVMKAL